MFKISGAALAGNSQNIDPKVLIFEFCLKIILVKQKKYQSNTDLKKNAQTSA